MSETSEWLERLGPLVRRSVVEVEVGSPVRLSLRTRAKLTQPISVTKALRRRGLPLKLGMDVVDCLLVNAPASVLVPSVADLPKLIAELAEFGVEAEPSHRATGERLASLRERLRLSQESFANRYALEVATLRNWEQGRTSIDPAVSLLIKVLERHPDLVARAAADA